MKIYEIPDTSLKQKKIILTTKKQQKLQPKNYEKYEFLKMTNTREEGKYKKALFDDEKKFKYLV